MGVQRLTAMSLPLSLPGGVAASSGPSTPILTQRSLISLNTQRVDPPTDVYVTINDKLHVVVYNSVAGITLMVAYRVLRADGEIMRATQTETPTSARARNDFFYDLPEGFLLSVDVSTNTANVQRGQCWVDIDISQGPPTTAVDFQSILSDYVTTGASIGYPGARQISSVEGPGDVNTIITAGGSPILFTLTVPTGARWLFHQMFFNIATDAVAGNRLILVTFRSGGNPIISCPATQTVGPSLNASMSCGTWGSVSTAVPTIVALPTPDDILLHAGDTIVVSESFGDPGDSVSSNITLRVEEWLEPVN